MLVMTQDPARPPPPAGTWDLEPRRAELMLPAPPLLVRTTRASSSCHPQAHHSGTLRGKPRHRQASRVVEGRAAAMPAHDGTVAGPYPVWSPRPSQHCPCVTPGMFYETDKALEGGGGAEKDFRLPKSAGVPLLASRLKEGTCKAPMEGGRKPGPPPASPGGRQPAQLSPSPGKFPGAQDP